VIGRVRTPQIWSGEDRAHIKALATAWFRTYKAAAVGKDVGSIDRAFGTLLTAAEQAPSTQKVRNQLKSLRTEVITLQTQLIAAPPQASLATDAAPSFATVPDPVMRQILVRRWDECVACLGASAPLAAIVMMGGLLESLFLARVNREPNQAAIYTSRSVPKDKVGKGRPLKEWGLGDFISVAHDLGWITQSGKSVSAVLQNYRNFIHPQKELASQAALTPDDARMLWMIAKEIAIRLL
jgi:hypothetical protein